MNEVWNKVYKSDSTFFGEEPSNFALLCFNDMKTTIISPIINYFPGGKKAVRFIYERFSTLHDKGSCSINIL
jgi:hypothetical protein